MRRIHDGLEQLQIRQLPVLVPRPFCAAQNAQPQPVTAVDVDDFADDFVQRADRYVRVSVATG